MAASSSSAYYPMSQPRLTEREGESERERERERDNGMKSVWVCGRERENETVRDFHVKLRWPHARIY